MSVSDIFASCVFLTRSLTLGIWFSTAVRAAVAAKLVILGILNGLLNVYGRIYCLFKEKIVG